MAAADGAGAASSSAPSPTSGPVKALRGLLAGPVAGICARLFIYPVDTLKARLQVQGALPANAAHASGGGGGGYRSTWHAATQVARSEGLRGFYRGFSAAAVGTIPANMMYFSAYEGAKALVPGGSGGMAGDMAVGAVAQLVGGVGFTPVDIIKERLQVAPLMAPAYAPKSAWNAVASLVKERGLPGLFRGYWATNAVWIPWNALYIALYENSKRLAAASLTADGGAAGAAEGKTGASAALPASAVAVCSAGSAGLAGLLTHPADVVKTRLQVLTAAAEYRGLTALSMTRDMWAREGIKVFFTGLTARILSLAPGTALSWVIYEPVKQLLSPPEEEGG